MELSQIRFWPVAIGAGPGHGASGPDRCRCQTPAAATLATSPQGRLTRDGGWDPATAGTAGKARLAPADGLALHPRRPTETARRGARHPTARAATRRPADRLETPRPCRPWPAARWAAAVSSG